MVDQCDDYAKLADLCGRMAKEIVAEAEEVLK